MFCKEAHVLLIQWIQNVNFQFTLGLLGGFEQFGIFISRFGPRFVEG